MREHKRNMVEKHASHTYTRVPSQRHTRVTCETTRELPDYLEVQGSCQVQLNGIDIGGGLSLYSNDPSAGNQTLLLDENVNHVVIGAWLHGKGEMALCRCGKTGGQFNLKVKVDKYSTDVLKVGVYLDLVDGETQERKLFPMQTCGVHVGKLVSGDVHEICNDEFNESLCSKLVISSPQTSFPVSLLQKSLISEIPKFNDTVASMSKTIVEEITASGMRAPKPAAGFLNGITYLPFCGMPSEGIPPLCGHYVLFGALISNLERDLPPAVPVYCFMLALAHGKYTIDEVLQLHQKGIGDKEYIHVVANIITGFTKDAGFVPYQRDGTPSMGAIVDTGGIRFGMTVETSEDIGIVGTTQTLMIEGIAPEYDETPLFKDNMTTSEIITELTRKEWPNMSRALGKDDCESTSFLAIMIFHSIVRGNWTPETLQKALSSYSCFTKLTPTCLNSICTVFKGIQQYANDGLLHAAPVIGLAGGASADNTSVSSTNIDENTTAGGHCFGVLKACHPDSGEVITEIIEGTNSVTMVPASAVRNMQVIIPVPAAQVGRHMSSVSDEVTTNKIKTFSSTDLATEVSMYIGGSMQISKNLLGSTCDEVQNGIAGEKIISGHVRNQLLMNGGNPGFYNWAMTVGTNYQPGGVGYFPCGKEPIPGTPRSNGKMRGAVGVNEDPHESLIHTLVGCAPSALCDPKLLGYSVTEDVIPRDVLNIAVSVMNEVYPPVAPDSEFARVMKTWAVCSPIQTINQDFHKNRLPGVEYIPVNCMESPGCPLLIDGFYQLKKRVADCYNRISKDGSYMTVQKIGTGVSVKYYMPVTDKPLDLLISLPAAKKQAGWPA